MVDTCSVYKECLSKKQGLEYVQKYSIPKKLLVAISVVAVVAMCLRPVEAASIEHRQRDSMSKLTKDRTAAHRTRHHHRNATLSTKESSSHSNDDPYEKARAKIENRVAFMKHNFDDGRKNLTESKYYGSGMTDWLPKTNFVNIHFQYKRMSRKQLKPRRLFIFHIQRLYKSLRKYYDLFQIFKKVEVLSPDRQILDYNRKRESFFTQTAVDLYTAVADIGEYMDTFNVTKPESSSQGVDTIEMKVDAAKYLKNDEILLRAYGNLLANWYLELNCSNHSKSRHRHVTIKKCNQYERNLRAKKNKRRQSNHKQDK